MASSALRLGILDHGLIEPGLSSASVAYRMISACAEAEALGYERYWLSEHHEPHAFHSSPEVLLPLLAAHTERIKIGTGGVLLRFYSPFKVAETFRLLATMFPGRIELGVGRSGGSKVLEEALWDATTPELAAEKGQDDAFFTGKVERLLNALHAAPFSDPKGLAPSPRQGVAPPVWLLGTRVTSMYLAARRSLPVAISLFHGKGPLHAEEGGRLIEEAYTKRFVAIGPARPEHMIAISLICAETHERAVALDQSIVDQGSPPHNVIGTPRECRDALEDIAARYDTRQIVVCSQVRDGAARATSWRLLSAACGLTPSPLAATPA